MISFYIDNKPDMFKFDNKPDMFKFSACNLIAAHPHLTNCTMVPVPSTDWTNTKSKHQEQKNLTQLEKQIENY